MPAAIASDLNTAIIGTNPDHFRISVRDGNGQYGVVVFSAADVMIHRTARDFLLALVIASEIGADDIPVSAAVSGFEADVGAEIDFVRVSLRHRDGTGPIEADI